MPTGGEGRTVPPSCSVPVQRGGETKTKVAGPIPIPHQTIVQPPSAIRAWSGFALDSGGIPRSNLAVGTARAKPSRVVGSGQAVGRCDPGDSRGGSPRGPGRRARRPGERARPTAIARERAETRWPRSLVTEKRASGGRGRKTAGRRRRGGGRAESDGAGAL